MLYPLSYGGHGHQCAASTTGSARTAKSRRFRPGAHQTVKAAAGVILVRPTVVGDGVSSTA